MSMLVLGVEWRRALADKRGLAFRALAPLVLVLVLSTAALSPAVASAAYVALFVGLGMLGTVLPVLSDERSGLTARVMRGGVPSASYLLQRSAAGAGVALVTLVPALAVVVLSLRAAVTDALIAFVALAVALWIGSVLAVVAAAASRSATEALVLCGMILLLLLHVSGVFYGSSQAGWMEALEAASPFRALYGALVTSAPDVTLAGTEGSWPAAAAWAVILPILVGFLAHQLSDRPRGLTAGSHRAGSV